MGFEEYGSCRAKGDEGNTCPLARAFVNQLSVEYVAGSASEEATEQ